MSIIGTRPPLISETNLYELHHRARLAIKPGITGMWQVSGRSDITDFEEVVRLDKEYITNWNIGLDIKILFKTILVQNLHTLNCKHSETFQSLRHLVPAISERCVLPKHSRKREDQCRSRAAAEIQSNEAVEG